MRRSLEQPVGATVTVGHSFAVTAPSVGIRGVVLSGQDGSPIWQIRDRFAAYSVSSAAAADSGSYTVAVSEQHFRPTTAGPATGRLFSSAAALVGTPALVLFRAEALASALHQRRRSAALCASKSTLTAKALVTFCESPVKGNTKISKVLRHGSSLQGEGTEDHQQEGPEPARSPSKAKAKEDQDRPALLASHPLSQDRTSARNTGSSALVSGSGDSTAALISAVFADLNGVPSAWT